MGQTQQFKGTFYVKKNKAPGSWSLYFEHYKAGKRKQEKVEKIAYAEIGLSPTLDVEDARARIRQINKERKIQKDKARRAASNLVEITSLNDHYFPLEDCEEFQVLIEDENFGSEAHLKKLISHFKFIQKMVVSLKLSPEAYKENSRLIYRYFVKKQISVSYSTRLVNLLNRWGAFQGKKKGFFYDPVKAPKGTVRSSIADSQKSKSGVRTDLGVRTESLPLSPKLLEKSKDNFTNPGHYNWLEISLWFGLRPNEVDSLHENKWSINYDRDLDIEFLTVYQPKLTSLPDEQRYKHIPVIVDGQRAALETIRSGLFKRPHPKTVSKHTSEGVTLYGGRKGFVDLMLGYGQKIEDISIWLGHRSIETTWRHYKNKTIIRFTKVG
jgi:integrase